MFQSLIYSFLISAMMAHGLYASTYFTEDAANEGVRRGATESFTSSTGIINADSLNSDNEYIW